ncbi:hypothetical protein SDRG_07174 [Saprolegnia diclina VS20]|uniref:Isochorismatase-like domain-containing protein n=1 Tax=Saprolegnia diclina (strain VS20) TaxID=1156394 RepID=T0QL98_SAPDV|nr:hypothetical protein SDRG_07174 [Saprolegnia diclina VS20]EQC35466.1 hypothetical protein SDRG_07174 [Saprolegnia diclina VS20]|eukprot:XP_008611216.1 hypothetical protein SDRG_07174 [Saprolegnia diclina VS20]
MVATSTFFTSLVAFGASVMASSLRACNKTALIIVDVQNDFTLSTGSLSVTNGEAIIPIINKVRDEGKFDMVVLTQDWHPVGHVSFYSRWSADPKAKLFAPYTLPSTGPAPVPRSSSSTSKTILRYRAAIPIINDVRRHGTFDLVATTQDWHPLGHVSLGPRPKRQALCAVHAAVVWPPNTEQVLWPNHCTQNQDGAKFHKDLKRKKSDIVIQKATS